MFKNYQQAGNFDHTKCFYNPRCQNFLDIHPLQFHHFTQCNIPYCYCCQLGSPNPFTKVYLNQGSKSEKETHLYCWPNPSNIPKDQQSPWDTTELFFPIPHPTKEASMSSVRKSCEQSLDSKLKTSNTNKPCKLKSDPSCHNPSNQGWDPKLDSSCHNPNN